MKIRVRFQTAHRKTVCSIAEGDESACVIVSSETPEALFNEATKLHRDADALLARALLLERAARALTPASLLQERVCARRDSAAQ